jgi:hypothetical protein
MIGETDLHNMEAEYMPADSSPGGRTYREEEPGKELISAAGSMISSADAMAAASLGTVDLHSQLISVRFLSASSAALLLGQDESEPANTDVIEVTWVMWYHDGTFAEDLLAGIGNFAARVSVEADVLLAGEAVSYGLGPEDSFLDTDSPGNVTNGMPEEVLEALAEHLRGYWPDDLVCWAGDDRQFISDWPQPLRSAAEEILEEYARRPPPSEPMCPACGARMISNLMGRMCSKAECRERSPRG